MKERKNFNIYYAGIVISNIGNAMAVFVLPLYILDLTKSTMHLSIISALKTLPILFLGIPFGAIIDKVNIRKWMQIADLIRFLSYFLLYYVMCVGTTSNIIVIIYVTTIITGVCQVFHGISEVTFIPLIVVKKDIVKSNSMIFGAEYVANFIVPIIGGKFYNFITVKAFILLNAFSFLVSAIVLFFIKENKLNNKKIFIKLNVSEIFGDVIEGFRLLKEMHKILGLLVVVALSNLVIVSYFNCILSYFRNYLQFSEEIIGRIVGIYSLGALAGASLAASLKERFKYEYIILGCIGVDAALRFFIPINHSAVIMAILLIFIELTSAIMNIMVISMRQHTIQPQFLGRINSVFKTVLLGASSIGLILGGVVMKAIGERNTLVVMPILCVGILVLGVMVVRIREQV